jgi:hypothetical protein
LSALLLVMADFLDPNRGPDQRGDFRVSPTFFLVMVLGGFLVGAVGHLVSSRVIQAIGVLMILTATVFVPIFLGVTR